MALPVHRVRNPERVPNLPRWAAAAKPPSPGAIVVGVIGLALLSPGAARADSPVEPGKVFVGPEGLMVAVVPLRPRADNKVLVQVTGSGSVFDGKVIPHKVDASGGDKTDIETTYRGRRWVTIAVRDNWWQARAYSLHVPGRRDGPTVNFDEKRTKELKADELHKIYAKQEADGTLRAMMSFDRKQETADEEKGMQRAIDSFAKHCGAKPAVTVNWASMSDADIQDLSIASYCGEPLEKMANMCKDSDEAKKAIAASVKSFVCTLGKTMQLELAGTTLTWTTARSATNMGDFTRKYLEKKL
jgi:hypothetical protein